MVRIEEHGAAHGRPRRRAETIVAYTRALSGSALPDPRLADIGRLVSQALFGPTPPSADHLTQADAVLTEIIEKYPEPTRADRRHQQKDPGGAAPP
ncbi:hypothetical protein BH24ACT3_BH24ACT3_00300 [soil metagenome]